MEHLAETFRLPAASVPPPLQCPGVTSGDQLGSLHVEPSGWSSCQYFFCTIIFYCREHYKAKGQRTKIMKKKKGKEIHFKRKIPR